MDWMVFDAMYPLPFGWGCPAALPPPHDCAPSETDLWITAQTYEFVVRRSTCEKCGAAFRRKLDLAVLSAHGRPEGTWLIAVGARCRAWRRHRHTAVVAERRGELRFGGLRPG